MQQCSYNNNNNNKICTIFIWPHNTIRICTRIANGMCAIWWYNNRVKTRNYRQTDRQTDRQAHTHTYTQRRQHHLGDVLGCLGGDDAGGWGGLGGCSERRVVSCLVRVLTLMGCRLGRGLSALCLDLLAGESTLWCDKKKMYLYSLYIAVLIHYSGHRTRRRHMYLYITWLKKYA